MHTQPNLNTQPSIQPKTQTSDPHKKLSGNKRAPFLLLTSLLSIFTLCACGGGSTPVPSTSNSVDIVLPDTNSPELTEPELTEPEDSRPKPVYAIPTDTDLSSYDGPNIGYFENKVTDDVPTVLFAADTFNDTTNDSSRVQAALNSASAEDNGGVVILRVAQNSENNRYSLARIEIPSNIRLEVEPEVVLEMRGPVKETTNINKPFLFTIGRSASRNRLLTERIKNIEITSTDPSKNFTIDSKTNMPFAYGEMVGGNGNGGSGNTFETGVNLTRSIPVALFYTENFSISNITIEDNHTESVSVQMYADTDYRDGAYAYRFGSTPVYLEEAYVQNPAGSENLNRPMNEANIPLKMNDKNEFINDNGDVVPDMFAIKRNPNWGRTPIKGSIKNIKALNAHTGYGAVQAYGADWVEIDNIEAFNGIGVRVEAGNGTRNDNANRAGPYYSSMSNLKISNIKVTNGFTGVWLKSHSKIMKNISVENIEAIDSGTALLVEKGTLCRDCRELTRGRINDLTIKGDIILRQTRFDTPLAEVGYVATFFLSQTNRAEIATNAGKSINTIGNADIPRNLSGSRWYLIYPLAPVLALSELSATEIGDESAEEGFFPVDYSNANIISDSVVRPELILYRNDMRNLNGSTPTERIHE